MTVRQALEEATAILRDAGIENANRDARWLLAHALNAETALLAARTNDVLTSADAARFETLIEKRATRQPVSQIIGKREFYGREFQVTPDVLDPRPETEAMIDWALNGPEPARILDLGTGSGAIIVTLLALWPNAQGVATDISPAALKVAHANATKHNILDRLRFCEGPWWACVNGTFDLIVCNPPYIAPTSDLSPEVSKWEPHAALFAGQDGLEAYRALAPGLSKHLDPSGRAIFEFGADQGDAVQAIFAAHFDGKLEQLAELAGRPRFVTAARSQNLTE